MKLYAQYCVNSLRDECREFFAIHGRDGRDLRSPARFPCYYSPEKNDSVVTKFNRGRCQTIDNTWWNAISCWIFFKSSPGNFWICLIGCSPRSSFRLLLHLPCLVHKSKWIILRIFLKLLKVKPSNAVKLILWTSGGSHWARRTHAIFFPPNKTRTKGTRDRITSYWNWNK